MVKGTRNKNFFSKENTVSGGASMISYILDTDKHTFRLRHMWLGYVGENTLLGFVKARLIEWSEENKVRVLWSLYKWKID